MGVILTRGHIVAADLDWVGVGEKYYLLVSSNERFEKLGSALALRLTTTPKPPLPSIVEIPPTEKGFSGRVVCSDIYEIYPEDVKRKLGFFSPAFMLNVNEGIKNTFGIHT